MREKIISLAKGNFTYDAPELVLPGMPLAFSVTAGERQSYSFPLTNARGSKIKGFGVTEDVHIDFLPFFDSTEVELSLEVNAEELSPGEHLRGVLLLVTDCGEAEIPYDIEIISPELRDDKGAVRDYHVLRERMEDNPEHGAELFLSEGFQDAFLYRDESGKIIYDYLTKKNTKLQGMEEFLVAMNKKIWFIAPITFFLLSVAVLSGVNLWAFGHIELSLSLIGMITFCLFVLVGEIFRIKILKVARRTNLAAMQSYVRFSKILYILDLVFFALLLWFA